MLQICHGGARDITMQREGDQLHVAAQTVQVEHVGAPDEHEHAKNISCQHGVGKATFAEENDAEAKHRKGKDTEREAKRKWCHCAAVTPGNAEIGCK